MNFALSDEQEFLREAARGTLARVATLDAARAALDGEPLPDLWPAACQAGWPGLLLGEAADGAGLGPMEALLVFAELGRALAAVPLLGHLPASLVLDRARADAGLLRALASGDTRAAFAGARPPTGGEPRWTAEPRTGSTRPDPPTIASDGTVSGSAAWVPDAPGAAVLVVAGAEGRAAFVDAGAPGVAVEPVVRYDATRPLGHVTFAGAAATVLDGATEDAVAAAWHLQSALLAAESLGATERALETSVRYAKERFAFGRPIGSYQAIKHQLVEVLRRLDNARSLMYYAGWAGAGRPDEWPLAASAFRLAAGRAFEEASRVQISIHGGIGATWEHDAPLHFRKAQLSRRLLGGTAGAADAVADQVFLGAA